MYTKTNSKQYFFPVFRIINKPTVLMSNDKKTEIGKDLLTHYNAYLKTVYDMIYFILLQFKHLKCAKEC